jgi:GNAT superfamily N-acetyltransferase
VVIHLRKTLVAPPAAVEPSGFGVRTISVSEDVENWLALRVRAVAGLKPQPRAWERGDFAAEMTSKPWWNAERSWLAFAAGTSEAPIGAVTLAMRETADRRTPVVHWLLVDPKWRRRGVGRTLILKLEDAAWEAGFREVELETHSGWAAAVAFYQSIGYEPVRLASPR